MVRPDSRPDDVGQVHWRRFPGRRACGKGRGDERHGSTRRVRAVSALRDVFGEPAVQRINALAARAREGIEEAIRSTGITACVTGGGSLLRVHVKASPPTNYREAFLNAEETRQLTRLLRYLLDEGITMINTCTAAMSTAMGESEIDALVSAMERGFAKIRETA